jgi:Glycosyl transferase family 2
VNALTRDFDMRAHEQLTRSWRPSDYPTVDIFLPVCGEPIEVLHNTWTHVQRLVRRYPGISQPYVLDDANSPVVAAMAADFGFSYMSRPNRGWFKKAGNLIYGFHRSAGKYILILDADFAPSPDLLDQLLPYLENDPRLGIVQSPQFFRVLDEQNWIERGPPYRLEAWAVRMMYGWAHLYAVWDTLRGRQMAWKPTGSSTARSSAARRFWFGVTLWGGGTALAWVGLAIWRMMTMHPPDFALILAGGLFYALTVGRILVQPRGGQPA